MVTSNYSTPDMPEIQTQTPVAPVNTALIKAVEGAGDVAIGMRKQQNEAIDQKFLEAGSEYFRNVQSQIDTDPTRQNAMLFATLEQGKARGALSAEGETQLAKLRSEFGDLKAAQSQGNISTLQLQTRAQAMITRAAMARPDMGDEIRGLATDILGSDVTKASDLLYAEMFKAAGASAEKQKDVMNAQIAQMEKLIQYSPQPDTFLASIVNARKLADAGDFEGAAKVLSRAQMQFSGTKDGFQASTIATADAASNAFDTKMATGDFTNRLLSTDPSVSSAARADAVETIEQMDTAIVELEGVTGTQSAVAKAKAERLRMQRNNLDALIQVQSDPVKLAAVRQNQLALQEINASPVAKDAYARARPVGDPDKAIIGAASTGYSKLDHAGDKGYVYNDEVFGVTSYEGYQRLPVLWNTSKAATESALNGAVETTDMLLASYYVPMVNRQTGIEMAPTIGETKVVLTGANGSFSNMYAQLKDKGTPELIEVAIASRLATWDRMYKYIQAQLPQPYQSEYVPPNTAEEGFTGNDWYAGRYKGGDSEGFRKVFKEIWISSGLAAEMDAFRKDTASLEALLNSKNPSEE